MTRRIQLGRKLVSYAMSLPSAASLLCQPPHPWGASDGPAPLVTAVETAAKYFARVQNQQK